ncbi:MAG: serine/threonine-protein kinase [Polyangiaceae bacterium]
MDRAQQPQPRLVDVGRVLSERWTLVRELGAGGAGTVFEAVDPAGERFAIKVLHPELAQQRVARRRFQSEGYAANRVGHSDAIAILDDGVDRDGTVYLVMELLEGTSLSQLLNQGGELPLVVVATVASGVLDVLAAAHDRGVVHRDVKPGNIFITRDGKVKLLDFGVARVADRLGVSIVTKPGTTVGTPQFMAPEQAAGRTHQIDALTDVWAVGATLFQLLTQRVVNDAWSGQSAVIAAATRPAPPVRSIAAHVPAGIAQVVDRALSFKREERWPNARAMRQALLNACPELLQQAAEALGSVTEPEGPSVNRIGEIARSIEAARPDRSGSAMVSRGRRRALLPIAAILLLAVTSFAVWHWLRRSAPEPRPHSEQLDRAR